MQLIYSAFSHEHHPDNNDFDCTPAKQDFFTRYDAYRETCEKFKSEIAAIRKYFPGWMPNPPKF